MTHHISLLSGNATSGSLHRRGKAVFLIFRRSGILLFVVVLGFLRLDAQVAIQSSSPTDSAWSSRCRVEAVDYQGWQAQRIWNSWVELMVVPKNGGRLMQVRFNGHSYLFVNPKLAGKYLPPSQDHWYNYGGDKVWLLPEGDEDEHHWRGN